MNLVLNEIEKYRQSIAKSLVNEDASVINKVLQSEYGKEFFYSVKGTSGHGQGGTLEEVLKTYQKNHEVHPELFKIPDGYVEKTVSVSEYASRESSDTEKQSSEILNNPDLVNFHEKVFQAVQSLSDSDPIHLKQKNEKALVGLNAKKTALENLVQQLNSLDVRGKNLSEIMDTYGSILPDDLPSKQELFMMLSMIDMSERFKDQVEKIKDQNMFTKKPSIDTVSILTQFIGSYVREHYLEKKHGEAEAITASNQKTLRYLKKVWGTQEFEKGILATSEAKLNLIERGVISSKKKNITFVPSKGMQRIFSGDLGGACTSIQNLNFAKGKYENIVSYSLVIDKDSPEERFVGSFLVIETRTDDDEPILVIRANNPAQNLAQLDTDSLIEQIIGTVKRVAETRGIKKVGIAYNSGSASNRQFVVNYYQKSFSKENAIQLKKTEETTFNNHPIYNKNGEHPTVLV